jgi:hypothetical protein
MDLTPPVVAGTRARAQGQRATITRAPRPRPDVAVRVVEQEGPRGVVALDGPAGAVNVALVTSTNGKPRAVCSWQLEVRDRGEDHARDQPPGSMR